MRTNTTNHWLGENVRRAANTIANKAQCSEQEAGFFIYDLDALSKHIASLMKQDVVKLWYAVKANPLSRIITTLAAQGFNFDVASYGELSQVLNQGVNSNRILNTGPAKSRAQFCEFLKQGVNTFVIESVNQLHWLNHAAEQQNSRPQVLLRVQLQWSEQEKNPLGGNELTPFGLSCEQWQQINLADFPNLDIEGLHIFQWGNLLCANRMRNLWEQMVPPLLTLAKQLNMSLKVLDLGGGLGVDYLQSGSRLSWPKIISQLAEIKSQAGVEELWLELGRFAVAESGYYVTQVVDNKTNYQQRQLVVAGGINHILRPAITGQGFPAALLRNSVVNEQTYVIHGPLCTSLDKLGQYSLPCDINVEDYIIFGLAGAYGFTESMPFFLCHPIAGEYVLADGNVEQVRAPKPAEWYLC